MPQCPALSALENAPIAVTDLLEHEPASGPPSKNGTVTQLFTAADGNLAIDRDNRHLIGNGDSVAVDWLQGTMYNLNNQVTVNWLDRALFKDETLSIDWSGRILVDGDGVNAVKWGDRQLRGYGNEVILDWGDSVKVKSGVDLQLGNEAVAEVVTPTHTLTVKDSTGQLYKVLCVPVP